MNLALIAGDSAAWLAIHLSIAAMITRLGPPHFTTDGLLPPVHLREIDVYRRWLRIRRWKRLLPDAAPWMGQRPHRRTLATRDPRDLRQLVIETRRGEYAHWLMLLLCPLFFLWNPPRADGAIALYALCANLPCILVQRYNRASAGRLLSRRGKICRVKY